MHIHGCNVHRYRIVGHFQYAGYAHVHHGFAGFRTSGRHLRGRIVQDSQRLRRDERRRLAQHREGSYHHSRYIPLGSDSFLLRYGDTIPDPNGLHLPLRQPPQMDHRHLRRPMLHSYHILSCHQRHQRPVLHDTTSQGLDTLQHRHFDGILLCRILDTDAVALLAQSQCLQSRGTSGHFCTGYGLCRQ